MVKTFARAVRDTNISLSFFAIMSVHGQSLKITQHQQYLNGHQPLITVVLARLVTPCVVAKAGHSNSQADQSDCIAPQLFPVLINTISCLLKTCVGIRLFRCDFDTFTQLFTSVSLQPYCPSSYKNTSKKISPNSLPKTKNSHFWRTCITGSFLFCG